MKLPPCLFLQRSRIEKLFYLQRGFPSRGIEGPLYAIHLIGGKLRSELLQGIGNTTISIEPA